MKRHLIVLSLVILPYVMYSQVTPEWISLFNGPAGWGDGGNAIAVDSQGNVYVAGYTITSPSNTPDYLIVKYNSSGVFQWHQTYNGPGNFDDQANAIAICTNGDPVITGGSDQGLYELDYSTLRYLPGGGQQWLSHYNGLGSDDNDVALDIAVDTTGNIYITGASAGTFGFMWPDIATVKYNPNGDTLWTRRFGGSDNDRGTAIAVDDNGFVYVGGYINTGVSQRANYIVIKYTPAGDTAWTRFYNGPGNDDDILNGLAIDNQGNVYVTGKSWGIQDDYATIKYNASGALQWVARYNGPANSYDKAYDIKVDSSGNVYVTGASGGNGSDYDYTTICYNTLGTQQWVSRYNGPANKADHAWAMTLDNTGNIFVTGQSEDEAVKRDYVTVKYNAAGQEKWAYRYNGPGNYHDQGNAITADNSGNIYVTGNVGYAGGTLNNSDIVTMKFAAGSSAIDGKHYQPDLPKFVILPNPAAIDFILEQRSDDIIGDARIEIRDIDGRILQQEILIGVRQQKFHLGNLPYGIYLVRILSNSFTETHKLIITK